MTPRQSELVAAQRFPKGALPGSPNRCGRVCLPVSGLPTYTGVFSLAFLRPGILGRKFSAFLLYTVYAW